MASNLAVALDKLSPLHFPQMTFFIVRDVVKELNASSADAAIDKQIQHLSSSQQDVLMKVLYVALSADAKNSSVYLKWHSLLFTATGPGAILRVLTDKPPVSVTES